MVRSMPYERRRVAGRHSGGHRSPSRPPLLLIVLIAVPVLVISGFMGIRHFTHNGQPSVAAHSPPNVVPSAAPSSRTPSGPVPNAGPALELSASFAELEQSVAADIGLTVGPLGASGNVQSYGQWSSGPAWSTSKIPLVMAAIREQDTSTPSPAMQAAITESDNQAAERIWESLGDPPEAAQKVEAVLRETGDPTVVQSQRIRSEYTAFGQTIWPLADQEHFLSQAACDARNTPVLQLMRHIEPSQRWGLGTLDGTEFKGGWGPSTAGKYLVRQFGLISTPDGGLAVALAAQPASGSFDDGIAVLNSIAKWISLHLQQLPAGNCHG